MNSSQRKQLGNTIVELRAAQEAADNWLAASGPNQTLNMIASSIEVAVQRIAGVLAETSDEVPS